MLTRYVRLEDTRYLQLTLWDFSNLAQRSATDRLGLAGSIRISERVDSLYLRVSRTSVWLCIIVTNPDDIGCGTVNALAVIIVLLLHLMNWLRLLLICSAWPLIWWLLSYKEKVSMRIKMNKFTWLLVNGRRFSRNLTREVEFWLHIRHVIRYVNFLNSLGWIEWESATFSWRRFLMNRFTLDLVNLGFLLTWGLLLVARSVIDIKTCSHIRTSYIRFLVKFIIIILITRMLERNIIGLVSMTSCYLSRDLVEIWIFNEVQLFFQMLFLIKLLFLLNRLVIHAPAHHIRVVSSNILRILHSSTWVKPIWLRWLLVKIKASFFWANNRRVWCLYLYITLV